MARRRRRDWGRGWVEVRPRASGVRYVARWREGDGTRSRTFGDEGEAWDFLDDRARDLRRGVDRAERTVDDALRVWERQRAGRWSDATRYTYRRLVKRHILPWFGGRKLSALTVDELRLWVESLGEGGKAREAGQVLRAVLAVAVGEGWLTVSPMRGIRLARVRPSRQRVWSTAEVRAVLRAVRGDAWWRAFYALALTTGMRRGELLALDWDDVDLDGRTVLIRRTVTTDAHGVPMVGEATKGRRARRVTLTALAVAAVTALPERAGLVLGRDGQLTTATYVHNNHKRWCRVAGVPELRVHDLRHTCATLLLAQGVPVKVVADILGHSSATITMDIYQHTTDAMHRQAADALGDALED